MKTDDFYRCFDFIVYALKAGKIHKFCYQNNYLRKALFELSEQGYICFCYTQSLKNKFVILDKETFSEVLTMKKFNIKDVFSWSNAEDAKQYIGRGGYFADSLAELQECVSNNNIMRLFNICLEPKIDVDSVFSLTETDYPYALFLPVDKVKEVEEKKWRAFKDLDDLKTYANKSVGSILVYRQKNKDNTMRTSVITDYVFSADCIFIGNRPFSFETLFEEYELLNEHGIWQPFGVLDES